MRTLFSQYGELEDVVVTTDRSTGKSKGYGFVTFRYATSATAAVTEPEKPLDVSRQALVCIISVVCDHVATNSLFVQHSLQFMHENEE